MQKFIERERSWIRARARGRVGKRLRRSFDESDLAQETCVQLLNGDPDPKKPRSYVMGVLRRISTRRGHRANREESTPVTDVQFSAPSGSPSQIATRNELVSRTRAALATLSDEHQMIVKMRILEGRSFRECALQLGCADSHARMKFHRAMVKLRMDMTHE